MILRVLSVLLLIVPSLLALGPSPAAADDTTTMAEGRARSEAFLRGDIASIWRDMTAEMRAALGSAEKLGALRTELAEALGEEREVTDEKTSSETGFDVYLRTGSWSKSPTPIMMQWTFDTERKIAGFFVRPAPLAADSRFLDYQTRAALRLPFDGEWYVFWGGRTLEQNYHAANTAQRFAYDLVVREHGATHRGEADRLENYFCWDRPILAPADATVVAATGDLPDQPIGGSDPRRPAGNHVVLDLGRGEFAFLAHMRHGSITVQAGDTVKAGQELGRCGNSGNTSEPHLHFHLQTTSDLAAGEGLPAFFESFVADGKQMRHAELLQGQTVSPDEARAR